MKKIITLLLFFLFCFHIIGVYISFQLKEYSIKKEIKRRIKQGVPQEELAIIRYDNSTKNQFDWKDKTEFRYSGTMYDVVRTEIINDSTQIFYCVNDKQETLLFNDLEKLLEQELALRFISKNQKKSPLSTKTLHKTIAKYVSAPQNFVLDVDWITVSLRATSSLCYYFNHYHSLFIDPQSPSPKTVSFSYSF